MQRVRILLIVLFLSAISSEAHAQVQSVCTVTPVTRIGSIGGLREDLIFGEAARHIRSFPNCGTARLFCQQMCLMAKMPKKLGADEFLDLLLTGPMGMTERGTDVKLSASCQFECSGPKEKPRKKAQPRRKPRTDTHSCIEVSLGKHLVDSLQAGLSGAEREARRIFYPLFTLGLLLSGPKYIPAAVYPSLFPVFDPTTEPVEVTNSLKWGERGTIEIASSVVQIEPVDTNESFLVCADAFERH